MTAIVRQDAISKFFTYLSTSELLAVATFGGQLLLISLLAIAIALVGLENQRLLFKGQIPEQPVNAVRATNYLGYAAAGVSVFFGMALFVPLLPTFARQFLQSPTLSAIPLNVAFGVSQLFVLLIAVAEEQFFRGFIVNFAGKLGGIGAALISAISFGAYHIAAYGGEIFPTIFIVGGAGFVLATIDIRTGSITPSLLGHVINNAFSSGLLNLLAVPNFIAALLAVPFLPTLIITASVWAVMAYRKGGIRFGFA